MRPKTFLIATDISYKTANFEERLLKYASGIDLSIYPIDSGISLSSIFI